jgi:thioredoxin 1
MVLTIGEKTFNQEVLASSTPVLVSFWAPWCGVCRLIDPLLSQLQTEWSGQIKLVKINADNNLKLANTYRLTTLPTVLLFDNGQLLQRVDQFCNNEDFRTAAQDLRAALEQIELSCSYSR